MKCFLVFFLFVNLLTAQKVVKKSLINDAVTAINIDVAHCYELELETSESHEMSVEAIIDGEYTKDLLLTVKENEGSILISSGFQPNFKNPNDKLSAHKVVSISLKVVLPRYKYVTVFGTSCNVFATGDYRKLNVTLNDGNCELFNVSEDVNVHTQSGHILVEALKADIKADSKYGKIDEEDIPNGGAVYTLTSVTGNIGIKKTE
ncbi:hypothetical protein [Zobellia alginiliquefaciens]|uniref:hypothetical protein n=1 Tax=Zobellia alginiliquefaciens TaxID=3032586 RepID=UPI0023E37E60|nr:hypothetical protein [Zobellia alginiliquefaciens]